jgi:phosphate-selective porin OprO/OprP
MKFRASRLRRFVIPIATLAVFVAGELVASSQQVAPAAQQVAPAANRQESRWDFVMDDRPSVRFGDALRVDFTGLLDFEWRGMDGEAGDDADFGRKRVGVDGRLFNVLAFEVVRDLGDKNDPWRDVLLEFRKYRAVRVRGGHFKIPFGAERLTSIRELAFTHRSVVTETLSPGRDTGVQIWGRLLGDTVTYMTGAFRHDGSSPPATDDEVWGGEQTLAGRLVVAPFAGSGPRLMRRLELGVGYTHGELSEGLHSPALRTAGDYEAFAPVYVAGTRQRFGLDASLTRGPFSVAGEYLRLGDQRQGQGLEGDDLPDLIAEGWYVAGTWMAVGDLRNGNMPRSPLFKGGAGAIQLAGRIEALGFHSDAAWDDPFRNPRAANVLANDFRAWTAGVNWYPVRYVKLQLNIVREHLGDPERRPVSTRAWSTSRLFRVQFAL